MNKTEYNEFVSAVQNMIFNFISEYDIVTFFNEIY